MKPMKFFTQVTGLLACTILLLSCDSASEGENQATAQVDRSIMVFSKTEAWRHSSIEAGVEAIQKLGEENSVNVFATEDAAHFNSEELAQYDAVVFMSTTGDVLNDEQQEAFTEYINNGGGYAGIHSATDTEHDWPWYNRLAGAYFQNHPPGTPDAVLHVVNQDHISTEMLPETWPRTDEWYNFSDLSEDVNVLITIDTDSYEGSTHPGNHPMAWYHEFEGGRSFYTGLGHTEESFRDDKLFLQHMWGGIQYAMGAGE